MGADTFWSSINNEPKRKYKYVVEWGDVPWFVVSKTDLPKYTNGETEVNALNHTFYYPGRIKWETITMEITDSESLNSAKTLQKKLIQSGYAFPKNANQFQTISKKSAVEALGQLVLKEITGGGAPGTSQGGLVSEPARVIGEWTFKNAWIKESDNGGSKEYASDDVQKITLTVRYDWAQYKAYALEDAPYIGESFDIPE